jgi:hypothetical protein
MQPRGRGYVALVAVATFLLGGIAGWLAPAVIPDTRQEGSATVTTAAQIRAHPNLFGGRRVQLAGRLTECSGWECSLCPEAMTTQTRDRAQCLALSFRPLIPGTGFGSLEQEEVFRFSSVVLTATFNLACWNGGCTDRGSVLWDAAVVSVTQRRSSNQGTWLGKTTPLAEFEGPEATAIQNAAVSAGYDTLPTRVFMTREPQPRFVVCSSPPGSGTVQPGRWPATFEGALYAKSTLDFYRCSEARRVEDRFVVQAGRW